jgi:hypothetical protein
MKLRGRGLRLQTFHRRASPHVLREAAETLYQNSDDRRAVEAAVLELVVASYCENLTWFLEYEGPISVYAKSAKCDKQLRSNLQGRPGGSEGNVEKLPNVGREGDTYLTHIVDNYDSLATYTAFTQGAGEHNGAHAMEKIREFLMRGNTTTPIMPIVPSNDKGPILYRDMEKGELGSSHIDENNIYNFPYVDEGPGNMDYGMSARLLYVSLFGGDICDTPPPTFAAGAQLIVHRDTIRAKPKWFYEFLKTSLQTCDVFGLSYDLERMWLYVFNKQTTPASHSAQEMRLPYYCDGEKRKDPHCSHLKKPDGIWEF